MPIDYIKAQLVGAKSKNLLSNPYFTKSFETYKDNDFGENYKYILKHKNLNIIIYKNNYVLLTGSLHYYFNNGKHNYNHFRVIDVINTIKKICRLVEVHPSKIRILNIEFGVNLTLPYKAKLIANNLQTHRNKVFLQPNNFTFRKVEHQRFYIKAYDKGSQFKQSENIFRFELKYKKMKTLNEIGLYTLFDLSKKEIYKPLYSLLISKWQECILYDFTIDETQLRPLQKRKSLQYQISNFWLKLTPIQRAREKKHLKELSEKYGSSIQQYISNEIQENWKKLISEKIQSNLSYKGLLYIQNEIFF